PLGEGDDRQLCAVYPRVPQGSFWQRPGEVLAPGRCGCRAVCATPGSTAASEASQAAHHRAALLPAIRALPGGDPIGFGRGRAPGGELVDVLDPPGHCTRPSAPTPGSYQSAYRGRTSRLCDLAPARTLGAACRRSGVP